jgi:antibiotic biosynthesis monooxygenase (ABM) superfamily enzyme
MIARLWHGWTTPGNADVYESLLRTEVFPGILAKSVAGLRNIELLRRPSADEVEFVTIMRFDTLEAVKAFAGADYETAYVPPAARAVLSRFDATSQHYEIKEERAGANAEKADGDSERLQEDRTLS